MSNMLFVFIDARYCGKERHHLIVKRLREINVNYLRKSRSLQCVSLEITSKTIKELLPYKMKNALPYLPITVLT